MTTMNNLNISIFALGLMFLKVLAIWA